MSVVIRFTVPAAEFSLGRALSLDATERVRLETVVPTSDATVPYLWVPTEDADDVETSLSTSPLVDTAEVVDETGEETLFRVRWEDAVDGVLAALRDTGGALLKASGTADLWTFRARFGHHDDVSVFHQRCLDAGISLTLEELHDRATGDDGDETVTDAQREALLAALEAGYYDVPRAVTLEQLADRLDISDTALSQRLRRGTRSLLESTLPDAPPLDDGDDD